MELIAPDVAEEPSEGSDDEAQDLNQHHRIGGGEVCLPLPQSLSPKPHPSHLPPGPLTDTGVGVAMCASCRNGATPAVEA